MNDVIDAIIEQVYEIYPDCRHYNSSDGLECFVEVWKDEELICNINLFKASIIITTNIISDKYYRYRYEEFEEMLKDIKAIKYG